MGQKKKMGMTEQERLSAAYSNIKEKYITVNRLKESLSEQLKQKDKELQEALEANANMRRSVENGVFKITDIKGVDKNYVTAKRHNKLQERCNMFIDLFWQAKTNLSKFAATTALEQDASLPKEITEAIVYKYPDDEICSSVRFENKLQRASATWGAKILMSYINNKANENTEEVLRSQNSTEKPKI